MSRDKDVGRSVSENKTQSVTLRQKAELLLSLAMDGYKNNEFSYKTSLKLIEFGNSLIKIAEELEMYGD